MGHHSLLLLTNSKVLACYIQFRKRNNCIYSRSTSEHNLKFLALKGQGSRAQSAVHIIGS